MHVKQDKSCLFKISVPDWDNKPAEFKTLIAQLGLH